jgi:hypothetical protein
MNEICFKFIMKLWRQCEKISVTSMGMKFNGKTIQKSRSSVIERSVS